MIEFLDSLTRPARFTVIFCAVWTVGSSMLLWNLH
jgi:hypothetical protein